MPCYDDRNTYGNGYNEGMSAAQHNSPVAELLCYVLRNLPAGTLASLTRQNTPLHLWWQEHQARDARKKAEDDRKRKEEQADKEIARATKQIKDQIRKKHGLV